MDCNNRIGLDVDKLVAGVVGKLKFLFNVFRDKINNSARILITFNTMMVNFCKTLYESSSFEEYFGQSNFVYMKRKAAAEIYFKRM